MIKDVPRTLSRVELIVKIMWAAGSVMKQGAEMCDFIS
jgi:hypothetical protein